MLDGFILKDLLIELTSHGRLLMEVCVFMSIGEKKLGKVVTPDPWKTGARNITGTVLTLQL